jgi:hypothetical protein
MSGFEHYNRELRDIDHEIARWAVVCGIDPTDVVQVEACRKERRTVHGTDHPYENLRGLLLLRLKLEAEMIELGMVPRPYAPPAEVHAG